MSTEGRPEDGPETRPRGGLHDDSDSPPWERPDLPAWWPSAIGPVATSPPSRRRGAIVAVITVIVVVLGGAGAVVVVRGGRPDVVDGASNNALGSTSPSSVVVGAATPPSPSATQPSPPRGEAQVRARLHSIQQAISTVRGLAYKHQVPADLLSDSKLKERVRKEVAANTDEDRVRAEGRALELLGQLPAGTDLVGLLGSAQEENVIGYYAPGKGRLYARSEGGLTPYAEFALSHELTHALTDQHFDLTKADRLRGIGRGDELLGFIALAEGDATFTMQRYFLRQMSRSDQLSVGSEGRTQRTPVLDGAPPVVRQSLGFPYQAGMIFVQALHRRGGWAAVNRAYADPPTSSEQILHPERYLAPRDEPQRVSVPDLHRALGKGWRAGINSDWGEADARFLLAEQVPVTAAKDAAAGWDGGQVRTFEHGGRTALVLRTVWDSEREATEFCETMARWASGRLGLPVSTARWAGSGQQAALVCAGTRATWLTAPDTATLERLRRGLDGKP
jgi:hypothetical protein